MTNASRTLLPMASPGCACCAPSPSSQPAAPAAVETPAPAGTSATYRVEGMTCGHCAGRVTEEITALNGVTDVHIDLVAGGTSTVTVTAEHPLSTDAVRAAIEEVGYTLTAS